MKKLRTGLQPLWNKAGKSCRGRGKKREGGARTKAALRHLGAFGNKMCAGGALLGNSDQLDQATATGDIQRAQLRVVLEVEAVVQAEVLLGLAADTDL